MSGILNKKAITIKDIAQQCSVSTGTVSRVINRSGAVSETARKKVEEAINRTGFQPSSAARSMVNKKSEIIGIIVPEVKNPFLAHLVELLEIAFASNGLSIMLCNTGYQYDNIQRFTDNLVRRNAEGVIFVASDLRDEERIMRIRQKLNVVLISSSFGDFDNVNTTDWQSAFEMTEYLISMGHTRIACMGYHEYSIPTIRRFQGYCDAMKKHGLGIDEQMLMPSDSVSGGIQNRGYILAKKLLDLSKRPTAIFAINDYYAVNVYLAVKEAGLTIGRDISVVGFDDVDISQLVDPPLTTVRYSIDTLAGLAVDIMMRKIRGEASDGAKSIQLSGVLIKRDSVADIARTPAE